MKRALSQRLATSRARYALAHAAADRLLDSCDPIALTACDAAWDLTCDLMVWRVVRWRMREQRRKRKARRGYA